MLFSARLDRRLALWWGLQPGRRFYSGKECLNRLRERYLVRDRNDPETKWRCCEFWQRSLEYKWKCA